MTEYKPLRKMWKQKSPNLSIGTWALQDGLGFKKMKSIEIFRNHKKLKNN